MTAQQTPSAILFVDQYASFGGGQTLLIEMLGFALAQGHVVTLMAPPGGELQARVRERFGSKVQWMDCSPLQLQSSTKGVGDFLKLVAYAWHFRHQKQALSRFSRIHVNGPRMAFPILAAAGLRPRVLVHLHLNHGKAEKLLLSLLSLTPAFLSAISISSFVHAHLPHTLKRKTRLVANWLPQAEQIDHTQVPSTLSNPPTAAVVGRLSPEKGQIWVVHAAKELPHWRFLFIGSAAQGQEVYEKDLRALAPSNCTFLGESRTPWQLAQAKGAQIALVPSQWEEPFGLVVLEAYARGFMTAVCPRGELERLAQELRLPVFKSVNDLVHILQQPPVWPTRVAQETVLTSPQRAARELSLLWG